MHEHHNRSVFDKSSTPPAGKLSADAPTSTPPRAIEVWCEICPTTAFALRSVLIEVGWNISKSAFCPVCARSI